MKSVFAVYWISLEGADSITFHFIIFSQVYICWKELKFCSKSVTKCFTCISHCCFASTPAHNIIIMIDRKNAINTTSFVFPTENLIIWFNWALLHNTRTCGRVRCACAGYCAIFPCYCKMSTYILYCCKSLPAKSYRIIRCLRNMNKHWMFADSANKIHF